jgi:hypothetical protein
LLQYYRTRDPKTPEELEMLNNVFDCLCSALLYSENKTKFLQGEGIELMIILLRYGWQYHAQCNELLHKRSSMRMCFFTHF